MERPRTGLKNTGVEYLNCLNQMPGQMYNPAHSFFD